jgi:hypothetical protein
MNVRNKIMFCATLLCGIATVTVGATEQRPNIIFLLTDDQSAGTLGCEGNLVIQTPNIDRLAANGVRFSDAHVVNPVCAPSRANYLTGQYVGVNGSGFPHAFGTISNEQWEKSYPALLRNNGYWTGFIGKFGVEYHEFKWREQEKFDFWYAHNQWARFHIKEQNREHTRIYKDAKSGLLPEVIGEGIERFLKEAPKDKPFCLSVSFNSPHNSMTGSMAFELEGHKFGADTYTAPANRMPQLKGHPIYGSLYRDKHLDFMFSLTRRRVEPSFTITPTIRKKPASIWFVISSALPASMPSLAGWWRNLKSWGLLTIQSSPLPATTDCLSVTTVWAARNCSTIR